MKGILGEDKSRENRTISTELALRDPVVRFAVEHLGARVIATHPSPSEVDLDACGRGSTGGNKSKRRTISVRNCSDQSDSECGRKNRHAQENAK